jgi:hypothetical protein
VLTALGRLSALCACLVLAATAGCGGSSDSGSGPEAGRCEPPIPEFAREVRRGTVDATGGDRVSPGVAVRDHTVTIVGFCLPDSRLPDPAPALEEGGRIRYPIGGELQQTSAGWRNYYLYPATRSRHLTVRRGERAIGRISFDGRPVAPACALESDPPFEVVACGSIVVIEWASPLRFDARRIQALDIDALDEARDGRPLNYYDLGYRDGPGGLLVRFGIRPPRGDRVALRANFAYVREGEEVQEVRLDERTSFRLAAPIRSREHGVSSGH